MSSPTAYGIMFPLVGLGGAVVDLTKLTVKSRQLTVRATVRLRPIACSRRLWREISGGCGARRDRFMNGAVDQEHASLMHLHMDTRSWCYVCRDALCCVCVCVSVCMSDVFWWGNGDGIERCFG